MYYRSPSVVNLFKTTGVHVRYSVIGKFLVFGTIIDNTLELDRDWFDIQTLDIVVCEERQRNIEREMDKERGGESLL